MTKLNKKISNFISEHHVLTLATSVDNKPYCANCFYAYMAEENVLVFSSDLKTKHAQDALANDFIAGSIATETSIVEKIQGIQFNGIIQLAEQTNLNKQASDAYNKRFPFTKLMTITLWVIDLTFIKMTDNRLGFGKKLLWTKED